MKRVAIIVFLGLLFNALQLWAQPGDPGGGGNPTPITGIEILLVAGGILGIKRLYSANKKSK